MTITTRRREVNPVYKKPLAKRQQPVESQDEQRISRTQLQEFGLLDEPPGQAVEFSEEYTVTYLAIDTLHRHPRNRVAGDTAVAELAASIQDHGLQQPIKVRLAADLPEGHYQIVFGERRWRAATMAGLETIPAHVVELDDAKTLELIAIENALREDLNPIQKAELIDTLCTPVEEGGAGKTREEAGKVVGLTTGAAASNLVRLLELPKVWRQRVAAGELPESFARLLLPYKHVPELMKEFDKDFADEQKNPSRFVEDRCWSHRDVLAERLSEIVEEKTRSCDSKSKEHYGYGHFKSAYELHGNYACLIDLSDEKLRKQLKIVTVPVLQWDSRHTKKESVEQERALNTKLFDQLQIAAIKEHVKAGKAKQDKSKAKPKVKRKPTAAELKKQEQERRERYVKQLATWRIRWMRLLLSEQIPATAATRLLLWAASSNFYNLNWGHRGAAADQALGVKRRDKYDSRWEPTWKALCGELDPHQTLVQVAGRLLWPAGGLDARDQDNLPRDVIDDLVRIAQLDVEACWFALQRTTDADRQAMFEAFFSLHGKEQLEQLGRELDVNLLRAKSKAQMVKAFTGRAKTLALPKCLQERKPPARRRKK